jgi:biopolymer transport protein ExbD/biopolymer transport protein TolR
MALTLSSAARRQPEPTINVTPLVDVVLVLLIIFMVIAPALVDGEHIELPTILQPDPKPRDIDYIDVTIANNGTLIVEEEKVQPSELRAKVEAYHSRDPKRSLLLKTDGAVPYKKVRETFAMLQGIGFRGVSLKVVEKKQPGRS